MRASLHDCVAAIFACVLAPGLAEAQGSPFRRGDANLDGRFDVSDGIFTVRMIFLGEPPPGCDDAADMDDDGLLNITDAIYGMRFLFLDGLPPPAPFGACGLDETLDSLGCADDPLCEDIVEVPCLDQAMIDELLGGALEFTFCVPAGIIDLPVDPLSVRVCPEEEAKPCGPAETPGCPVEITSVKGTVDPAGRRVVVRFEGRVVDMPIAVTESLFNTTTTCLTDFHGQGSEDPFSFEVVIPLEVEEAGPGVFKIIGAGEGSVENAELALTSTGGLVCRLFEAGQSAFIGILVEQIDLLTKAVTGDLSQGLVGLGLCIGQEG